MSLVHHVVMADGDKLLQVVRKELAPNLEAANSLLDRSTLEKRGDCSMGKAGINEKQTFNG